jgi:hypothetical protein
VEDIMWSTRIGTGLLGLVGLGISYIGISYLADPVKQAPTFTGGAAADPTAVVGNAKGVRDLTTGLAIAALLVSRQRRAAGWAALGGALIPTGDMLVVLARGGRPAFALAVHGSAAAATALAGVLLLRGTRPTPTLPVAGRIAS